MAGVHCGLTELVLEVRRRKYLEQSESEQRELPGAEIQRTWHEGHLQGDAGQGDVSPRHGEQQTSRPY